MCTYQDVRIRELSEDNNTLYIYAADQYGNQAEILSITSYEGDGPAVGALITKLADAMNLAGPKVPYYYCSGCNMEADIWGEILTHLEAFELEEH